MTSGLVLNDEVYFISFHGCYDFAYFLKILTGLPLPDSEQKFFESLRTYFPNYYDIRYLVRLHDLYRGSLQRLANELDVSRYGTQHQAGSDSIVTKEVFFTLRSKSQVEIMFNNEKNILFGFEANSLHNNGNVYNNSYNDDKIDQNMYLLSQGPSQAYFKQGGQQFDYSPQFFPMNQMSYQSYMNFRPGGSFGQGNMMVSQPMNNYR